MEGLIHMGWQEGCSYQQQLEWVVSVSMSVHSWCLHPCYSGCLGSLPTLQDGSKCGLPTWQLWSVLMSSHQKKKKVGQKGTLKKKKILNTLFWLKICKRTSILKSSAVLFWCWVCSSAPLSNIPASVTPAVCSLTFPVSVSLKQIENLNLEAIWV